MAAVRPHVIHKTHEYLHDFTASRIPLAAPYMGPSDESVEIKKYGTVTSLVVALSRAYAYA